jgi:hypothetical protein
MIKCFKVNRNKGNHAIKEKGLKCVFVSGIENVTMRLSCLPVWFLATLLCHALAPTKLTGMIIVRDFRLPPRCR